MANRVVIAIIFGNPEWLQLDFTLKKSKPFSLFQLGLDCEFWLSHLTIHITLDMEVLSAICMKYYTFTHLRIADSKVSLWKDKTRISHLTTPEKSIFI